METMPEGSYLILGCDGIFEEQTTDGVGEFVHKMLKEGKGPNELANGLIKLSYAGGSGDNMSVVVVMLKPPSSNP
jgi:serine/threonine protein phosphatase PrpC